MDSIAARAEITKPVLYDHFPLEAGAVPGDFQSIRDSLIIGETIAKTTPIRSKNSAVRWMPFLNSSSRLRTPRHLPGAADDPDG